MLFTILVLSIIIGIFFMIGKPIFMLRLLKDYMLRTIIAVLLIVCVNMIGGGFGIHLPVNVFTVFFTSLLGIPGMVMIIGLRYLFF